MLSGLSIGEWLTVTAVTLIAYVVGFFVLLVTSIAVVSAIKTTVGMVVSLACG